MSSLRHRLTAVAVAATVAAALLGADRARAAVTPVSSDADGARSLAAAIAASVTVTGASFESVPPNGTPNGIGDAALGVFPTHGATFAMLTSGDVRFADDPNENVPDPPGTAGDKSASVGGRNVRGNTDLDVTVLKIGFDVATAANCATFDFAFYSEEFAEFLNTRFNDGFVAELDKSTWTTQGSVISAPDNFAFDPSGKVISINSTGNTAMNVENAAGTTYDGATPLLSASARVTPGAHVLYLSVFDQGDSRLDSAVFIDRLVVGTVPDPETDCRPGAVPVTQRPPAAAPGGPYAVDQGDAIVLDGALSTDPEGADLTYSWDLDDDGAFETEGEAPAFSAVGRGAPAVQQIRLRVCDPGELCAVAETEVVIRNLAPAVDAGADRQAGLGERFALSGTFADPGGAADAPFGWEWDLTGDGAGDAAGLAPVGDLITQTASFARTGSFWLGLSVRDRGGLEGIGGVVVDVRPQVVDCTASLMPIGVAAGTVAGARAGDVLADILDGGAPGHRGWLTWTGDHSERVLARSLTSPGDSGTYVNPDRLDDHDGVSVRDWVRGRPGTVNSRAIRDALDELEGVDIVIPVWDQVRTHAVAYRVAAFARVRIEHYDLPRDGRIGARFLGSVPCGKLPPNQAPTARETRISVAEDAAASVPLSAADENTGAHITFDPADPAHGRVTMATAPACAPAPLGGTDCHATATYTPDRDFHGVDRLTYTARDGLARSAPATVTITVEDVNDPPDPTRDDLTLAHDRTLAVPTADLLANDVPGPPDEADQALELTDVATTPFTHGSVSLAGGVVTYAPDAGFVGLAELAYTVCDDGMSSAGPDHRCATGSARVRVLGNRRPNARDSELTTAEDTALGLILDASDPDGDSLAFAVTLAPVHGSLTGAAPNITYQPGPDFHGADEIGFTARDAQLTSTPGRVRIIVTAVNDPPDVGPDSLATPEDQALEFTADTLLANDTPGPPNEAAQALTVTEVVPTPDTHGAVTLAGPSVTYAPETGYSGPAGFTYAVCDDGTTGAAADPQCAAGTVSITVGNRRPAAQDLDITTAEDTPVDVTLAGSDPDGDALTFAVGDPPALGALSGTPPQLTYTPNVDAHGSDAFSYTAHDGEAVSAPALVMLSVTAVNDPPGAQPDSAATIEAQALVLPATKLLSNDRPGPADEAGQVLTLEELSATPLTHGTVALAGGVVTYLPEPGFIGKAEFMYRVCDDGTTNGAVDRRCATATVEVTVAVGDPPTVVDDSAATTVDTPVSIDVLANDSALPAFGSLDPATLTVVVPPAAGTATAATGAIGYTPAPGALGSDVFTYRVCTTAGACGQASVTVTVTRNRAPTAKDDDYEVAKDGSLEVVAPGVLSNDSDPDAGDALEARLVRGVGNGRLLLRGDGSFEYTPNRGSTGFDSFAYRAVDRAGEQSAEATVRIAVVGPPGPPQAAGDAFPIQTGRMLDVPAPGVLANDSAPDPRVKLTARLDADATSGSLVLRDDGSFTYAPAPGFTGTDSFRYVARDGQGRRSAAATVIVEVTGGGPPTATVQWFTPDESASVSEPVAATASITPPPDETVSAWTMTLRSPGDAPRRIAAGSGVAVSATLDSTALPNGTYFLAITAESSGGGIAVFERSVVVEGRFKPGRYVTSFDDLTVGAGMIPVAIQRTYDSADKRERDFGVGWSLSLSDIRVDTNGPLGRGGWTSRTCGAFPFLATCYSTSRPHFVTVTWPDERVDEFELTPAPGAVLFPSLTTAAFTARPGTTATLEPLGDAGLVLSGGDFLAGGIFGATGIYDPQRFRLTDRTGTRYTLDRRDGLLEVRDRQGNTVSVTRDGIVSSSGPDVRFERDGRDRITKIVDAVGATISYAYDARGDLATLTNQNGRVSHYSYEGDHYLTQINGAAPLQRFEYTNDGRLASITDASGTRIEVTADLDARHETVKGPDPRLTAVYSYDERGNATGVEAVSEGRRLSARLTYDDNRNLTEVESPSGAWSATYDVGGNPIRVIGPDGVVEETTYDSFARPLEQRLDGHLTARNEYGPTGLLTRTDYPDGTAESYSHDATGRIRTATNRFGRTTEYEYDSRGMPTRKFEPAGASNYDVDDAGRLTDVTDPAGAHSRFGYDAAGNLLTFTDANAAETPERPSWRWTYDAANRKLSESDPLGRTRRYRYDDAGRIAEVTDAAGESVRYEYSPAGLLRAVRPSDGASADFEYDGFGRLVRAANAVADILYNHGDAQQPSTETISVAGLPEPVTLGRTFTAVGLPRTVADPFGKTTSTYGERGDLIAIADTRLGTFTFAHDVAGRLASLTRPNGTADEHVYDRGKLSQQLTRRGDVVLDRRDYGYDVSGRLTSVAELDGTHTYSYDAADRLTSAAHPAASGLPDEHYTYDRIGNHTAWPGQTAADVRYDAASQLLSDSRHLYDYDAAGRLVAATDRASGATTRYEWNALGKLTAVRGPGRDLAFAYDAFGRQVGRTTNGRTRYFVFDGGNPRLVLDDQGALVSRHVGRSELGDVLGVESGGARQYPVLDSQGTTLLIIGPDGDALSRPRFSSFGAPAPGTAPGAGVQWSGLRLDDNLYTSWFRVYDTGAHRFLSPDPLPATAPYAYAEGDPLMRRDPTGLSPNAEYNINQLGKQGEAATSLPKFFGYFRVNGRVRIPDHFFKEGVYKVLGEVKNRASLSLTKQLLDYMAIARSQGAVFVLWVRSTTVLSGPLVDAVASGKIILFYLPW